MGFDLLPPLFAAAILGGVGSAARSAPGAVLGGLVVGLCEAAAEAQVGGLAADGDAAQRDRPGPDRDQPRDRLHQRRLARAAGPEHRHELAGAHEERDAAQDRQSRLVAADEVAQGEGGRARHAACRGSAPPK